MALALRLAKTSISSDGTILAIADTTGTYNVGSNPGGYGAPNPERDTLALVLRVFQKRYNKTETIVNTNLPAIGDSSDKLLVTTWDVALDKDAWIQANVYGLQLYEDATALFFQVGEVTWDVINSQFKKITSRTGTGPYTYTADVVPEEELDGESLKAYQFTLNTYAIPDICICKFEANKEWQLTEEESNFNQYLTIMAYIDGIQYAFAIGTYTNGQRIIETVEDLCTCFNDNCETC